MPTSTTNNTADADEYVISIKKWLKIWFSSDPNQFLSNTNMLRVSSFLEKNPNFELNIIYSSKLLNEKGIDDRERFRERFSGVRVIDFCHNSFCNEFTDQEKELYSLAAKELDSLGAGGVTAAASDIVRLLGGGKYGIYTDFDVELSKSSDLRDVRLYTPVFFSFNGTTFCNDVVGIAAENSQLLLGIQNSILKGYIEWKDRVYGAASYKFQQNAAFLQEIGTFLETLPDNQEGLLKARKKIEKAIKSADDDSASRKNWSDFFILTVSEVSGPRCYAFNQNSGENALPFSIKKQRGYQCYESLKSIIKSQLTGQVNDASWVPGQFKIPTDKWVMIWFTTNPDEFISEINHNRLNAFFENFPNRKMTLVYSSDKLSDAGKCARNLFQGEVESVYDEKQLELIDFNSDEFKNQLASQEEKALYALAERELSYFNLGGNPAAASDLTRLITTRYGIYTDFDVVFETLENLGGVKNSIPVNTAMLFSADSSRCCNDFIAVALGYSDGRELRSIQQYVIEGYNNHWKRIVDGMSSVLKKEIFSDFLDEYDKIKHFQPPASLGSSWFFSSTHNRLFVFRQLVEEKIKAAENESNLLKLSFWIEAYKQSVLTLSGPRNMELAIQKFDGLCYAHSYEKTDLSTLVQTQLLRTKKSRRDGEYPNDASWVPGEAFFRKNSDSTAAEGEPMDEELDHSQEMKCNKK